MVSKWLQKSAKVAATATADHCYGQPWLVIGQVVFPESFELHLFDSGFIPRNSVHFRFLFEKWTYGKDSIAVTCGLGI